MRRRRGWVIAAAVPAVAAVFYGAVSWVFSDTLIGQQFPTSDEQVSFADFGLPDPESVTIPNGQTRLAGWYFPNPGKAGCAVIQLHGFTSNKAEVLVAAPLFWDRGCDVLAYDLRGHGDSSPGLLTYGVLDKGDELAAVDWLAGKTGLPHAKIGLMGWSYGAATSLQAAAARQDLAFVIADASFSSLPDIASVQAQKRFGAWARIFVPGALLVSRLRASFDPSQASPEDAVRGLTTPVLLITSTTDGFTPYQQSEAIYSNSNPAHTRLVVTKWGAPHSMSYPTDPAAYRRIVDDFLQTFVPDFGGRLADRAIVTFEVAGGERFKVLLDTKALVHHAELLFEGQDVAAIPVGPVRRGDAGVNAPWSWQIDPSRFSFAFATIEVCDGIPSDVEKGLVTSPDYCPWSAKVVAIQPAP